MSHVRQPVSKKIEFDSKAKGEPDFGIFLFIILSVSAAKCPSIYFSNLKYRKRYNIFSTFSFYFEVNII